MLNQAMPLIAVVAATGGSLAAATTSPDASIAPYVGGGAGVVAVMALAEVTRRLMNGRLIARETRDVEAELSAAIQAAGQREAAAMAETEAMRRAADAMTRAAESATAESAALRRALELNTGEIAALRMRIERSP